MTHHYIKILPLQEIMKRKVDEVTKDNDKEFVKDGLGTSDIRKTIQHIRAYIEKDGAASLEDRIKQLQIDHAFFVERYPMLFEMATRPNFDYSHLNYFLRMRENIIEDKLSSDDASKIVGKEWFDKFVDVTKLEKKT
jgi:hypothetical protein